MSELEKLHSVTSKYDPHRIRVTKMLEILAKSHKNEDDYRYCENFINFYYKEGIAEEKLHLDSKVMKTLNDGLVYRKYLKETAIAGGEKPIKIYFLFEGTIGVADGPNATKQVKKGKILNYADSTRVTLKAETDVEVMEIEPVKYQSIRDANKVTADKKVDIVSKHFVSFRSLDSINREAKMKFFVQEEIEPGKLLISADKKVDQLYFLSQGRVAAFITKKVKGENHFLFLEILQSGDSFNDICCFLDVASPYSVFTLEKCNVLKLSKENFPLVADQESDNSLRGLAVARQRFLNEKRSRIEAMKDDQQFTQQETFFKKNQLELFKIRQQLVKLFAPAIDKQRIIDDLKRPIGVVSKPEERKDAPPAPNGVMFRALPNMQDARRNIVDATPRLVSKQGNPEAILARQKLLGTAGLLRGQEFIDSNQRHMAGVNKETAKGVTNKLLQEEKNEATTTTTTAAPEGDVPSKKTITKMAMNNIDTDSRDRAIAKNIFAKFGKTNDELVQKIKENDAPAEGEPKPPDAPAQP